MTTPLPKNEAERLEALRECSALDTEAEDVYESIVRLAAHICGTPIAAVSLVDSDRQWFKSILGLEARGTHREVAFCAHTILQDDVLIVPDAGLDRRFRDNPLVTGEPHIRFYAGAPLVTSDGHALGSLCVIDRETRELTADQTQALRLLAAQAVGRIEAARRLAAQQRLLAERDRAEAERLRLAAIVESSSDAIYSATIDRRITSWNSGAERLYGYAAAEVLGRDVDLLVPPGLRHEVELLLDAVLHGHTPALLETVRLAKAGNPIDVALQVSPIRAEDGRVVGKSMIARDISGRKRAEAALEREREFTRALLESLQEGIVACDAAGTLTLFNQATREFHGLPAQSLPAEQWAEHFDLYDADGLTPMRTEDVPLFRAFQGEVVRGVQMVIAPRDGVRRTLMASGRAIYGAGGEKLGAVVAMHDVTAGRQAEREMARFAAIVDSSHDAISAATPDGTIVSWNSAAERLYGRSAQNIIGRHFSVLAPPGAENPSAGAVARVLRGESVEPVEVERTRPDGSRVTLLLSYATMRGGAGEITGVVCVGHDITERREMEKALRESEVRLRSLTDAAFEGIVVSQGGCVVDANPAFAAILGYDGVEEILGRGSDTFAAPEAIGQVRRIQAERGEQVYETICLRRDGSRVQAEVRGRQGTWGGAPARVTAVRDITDRKQAEADLRENAEQLRRSEATLRTLLESAPVILYAADADGTLTLCEGTGLAALGLKPGEAVGRSVFEFSGGDAWGEENTRRALAGEAVTYDTQVGHLWLHVALQPVRGAGGESAGLIGVCFDVTERVASEERFRLLFEQSSDAHLLLDEGGILDCNPAAAALLGCSDVSQVLSVHPAVLSPEFQPDGRHSVEKSVEMDALAHERGFHRFDWVHRKMDGTEFPVEVTLTPVALKSHPALLVVWHDLTERKCAEQTAEDYRVVLESRKRELEKANAELEALATTDGLTGLRNHRAFQERLAEELCRAGRYDAPLSLLMLDVDRFKQYNDAFGHPEGDHVLRRVAQVLRESVRETDLAARYGGEEFVVVLPQTDAAGARVIAERIRADIEASSWDLRPVTVSVGAGTLTRDVRTPAALVARADEALYCSKADGRNRVTHSGDPVADIMRGASTSRAGRDLVL